MIMNYCAKCNNINKLKKCSKCNYICYCSTICQKEDWSKHKTICNSIIEHDKLNPLINYGIPNIGLIIKEFKKWLILQNNKIYDLSIKKIRPLFNKKYFLSYNINYNNNFEISKYIIIEKNIKEIDVLNFVNINNKCRIVFFNIFILDQSKIIKQVVCINRD